MLVTVDRGETRVAMLEAPGEPEAMTKSPARGSRRRRRPRGGEAAGDLRVVEIYFERRGGTSPRCSRSSRSP